MKKYLILVIFTAIFIPGICFANNSAEIQQLTQRYREMKQVSDEAFANYKKILQQQGSWWFASGEVISDDGANIYIFGSMGKGDNVAGGQGNVNVKIVNPNRKLIDMGVYNYQSTLANVVHHFVGTEEGRNSLGMPITIYVLEYDWDVNNQLDSYAQTVADAKNKMDALAQRINSLKQADKINSENKVAEKDGADAYKTGLYYIDKGDIQNAIAWLDKAVQSVEEQKITGSAKAAAYYYRALIYHRLGDYTRAADDYAKALWLDEPQPQDKKAKKIREKALEQAFHEFDQPRNIPSSINDSRSLKDTYRQYGHVLARTQRYNEAVRMLKLAHEQTEMNHRDWSLMFEYVVTLEMAGKQDETRRFIHADVENDRPVDATSAYSNGGYAIRKRLQELNKYDNYKPLSLSDFLYMTRYKWEPK